MSKINVAIANCLTEAIHGLGLTDDVDELVADRMRDDDAPYEDTKLWAQNWDIAIAFVQKNLPSAGFTQQPWVMKEVEEQINNPQ